MVGFLTVPDFKELAFFKVCQSSKHVLYLERNPMKE